MATIKKKMQSGVVKKYQQGGVTSRKAAGSEMYKRPSSGSKTSSTDSPVTKGPYRGNIKYSSEQNNRDWQKAERNVPVPKNPKDAITPLKKGGIAKKKMQAGGVAGKQPKAGMVDPKGAYTKVQMRTLGNMKKGGKMSKKK